MFVISCSPSVAAKLTRCRLKHSANFLLRLLLGRSSLIRINGRTGGSADVLAGTKKPSALWCQIRGEALAHRKLVSLVFPFNKRAAPFLIFCRPVRRKRGPTRSAHVTHFFEAFSKLLAA